MAISVHASTQAHEDDVRLAQTLIGNRESHRARDIRAWLRYPPGKRLSIRLIKNFGQNAGEVLPEENEGIAKLQAGQAKHTAWKLSFDFSPAATLSLDPKYDFLNGYQLSNVGHFHLTVVKRTEYQQMKDWQAKVIGAEKPASYRFFGGHNWYRTEKHPASSRFGEGYILSAESLFGTASGVEYGPLYDLKLTAINIDDGHFDDPEHGFEIYHHSVQVVFFQ